MKNPPPASWSESLQQKTRAAIEQISVTLDGNLHFKHATQGYAYATIDDLCQSRLVLHGKEGNDQHRFDDIEALLRAGWAVD